MVQTRRTLTAVMLALSESVVIMEWRVMVHLCHKILNHSGHKSVQQSVKADANVILDTIVIQIGECSVPDIKRPGPSDPDKYVNLFFILAVNVFRCINVPIMVSVARTNIGMNVEVTAKKINVAIY